MGGGQGEQETVVGSEAIVHIRCTNGSKFTVETDLESSVATFKTVVAEKCEIPADQQRLIYKGRILKDENTLKSYGLQNDHTVHLVRGSAPSDATSAAAPQSNPSTNTQQQQPAQGVPSSNNAGPGGLNFGSLLFPTPENGLGGNQLGGNAFPGLFGTGLPELQQVQQQLTQNPNMIREVMNMPAIQNIMNNPELMRSLIMSNPQMREIIDRNPDLAHILNDPNTLRQTLDAARNPELMREMMRNTDRAMSNIEASPEGFNMLRRMYETVQEPFLNATTMGTENATDTASNPFAALFGQGQGQNRNQNANPSTDAEVNPSPAPNTDPLPNPWNPSSNAAGNGAQGGQANAGARAARQPGLGGLPGMGGIAGMGGIPGLSDLTGAAGGPGLFDPATMQQLLQNPAIIQMMQGILSNPQYMNQLRPLMENSRIRDPEFLRQLLTNQDNMQLLLSLQQNLLSQMGRQAGGQNPGQTAGTGNNVGLESLLGMFGGLGSGGNQNAPNVPPEELYATQLTQLQEMGFYDTQQNIRALTLTGGDVHAAVDFLLANLG